MATSQKKRALQHLESQFGVSVSASASSPDVHASKKSKVIPKASTAPVSTRPAEDEVFYATLKGDKAGGRAKMQSHVEELLPTSALFNQKIVNQHIMLENPVQTASADAIAERTIKTRADKVRRNIMSAKEKKQKHWMQLDAKALKYEQFLPLHDLWSQYMSSTFADDIAKGRAPDENRVIKADCHGALLTVIRSQIPSQIGIRGIVLQETYHCFKLINADNRLVTVNKRHSIFSFVLGAHVVRLFGDQIIMRAAERSVKKFKHRNTIEL